MSRKLAITTAGALGLCLGRAESCVDWYQVVRERVDGADDPFPIHANHISGEILLAVHPGESYKKVVKLPFHGGITVGRVVALLGERVLNALVPEDEPCKWWITAIWQGRTAEGYIMYYPELQSCEY